MTPSHVSEEGGKGSYNAEKRFRLKPSESDDATTGPSGSSPNPLPTPDLSAVSHFCWLLTDHIEGLVKALEERHQLLTMMLDAVYVDMAQGLVLGLKPSPSFYRSSTWVNPSQRETRS